MPITLVVTVGDNKLTVPNKQSTNFYRLIDGKVSAKSFKSSQSDLENLITQFKVKADKNKVNYDDIVFHFEVTSKTKTENDDGSITINEVKVKEMEVNFSHVLTMMTLTANVIFQRERTRTASESTFNLLDVLD